MNIVTSQICKMLIASALLVFISGCSDEPLPPMASEKCAGLTKEELDGDKPTDVPCGRIHKYIKSEAREW